MAQKALTPMKRLNNHFKEINNLLGRLYKNFTLNKSKSSYRYNYSYTKGVQSDFITVFSPKLADAPSFSFVFNYLGEEEESFFAQVKMNKENDSIITSKKMNFDSFRMLLNSFIPELKNQDELKLPVVFEIFSKHFLREVISDEVGVVADAIYEFKQEELIKENIPELYESKKKLESKKTRVDNKIKKDYSSLPEHSEIEDLKNRIKELELQLISKKESIVKDSKLDLVEKEYSDVNKNIDKKEREINKRVEKRINEVFRDKNIDSTLKPVVWNRLKK